MAAKKKAAKKATSRRSTSETGSRKSQSQKDAAREALDARRARAEDGGQDAKGNERNLPGQTVHQEGEQVHKTHDENTDRAVDDIHDIDGRESEITEWRRHSDLDAPPPRDGFVNRFIRVRLGTVRDTARLRNAIREGWRPVKRESVSDRTLPSIHLENVGDVIGVEDLILCEMPESVFKKRQEFYRTKQRRQNAAIERQLAEQSATNVPGFGPIEQQRSSSVSVPRRQAAVADDEV